MDIENYLMIGRMVVRITDCNESYDIQCSSVITNTECDTKMTIQPFLSTKEKVKSKNG